jgi:hypothetical protein
MPYREKTAWLTLIAMAITFGPYFVIVANGFHENGMPNLPQLELYAAVAVTLVLILGVGHLLLRRASPVESRIPPDERDRAILRRSLSAAYYVLIAGMIEVGCIMPFNSGGWTIVHAALFMIVAAEIARLGVIVVSYRRQA